MISRPVTLAIVVLGATACGGGQQPAVPLDADGVSSQPPSQSRSGEQVWPPALASHVMTYHARASKVLLFGGSNAERIAFKTLWGWDGSGWEGWPDGLFAAWKGPSHSSVLL